MFGFKTYCFSMSKQEPHDFVREWGKSQLIEKVILIPCHHLMMLVASNMPLKAKLWLPYKFSMSKVKMIKKMSNMKTSSIIYDMFKIKFLV